MISNTLDRTEMIEALSNDGMPRHVAEQYCDLTLFDLLKNQNHAARIRPLSALFAPDKAHQHALVESNKERVNSYAHLGGMYRMEAAFQNVDAANTVNK
jgi:hypothetical protein